ncbi:MAG: radical SAM protein [Prevotella sp.]|nr:radical SAM protein [Prevotella sp.]
MADGYYWRPEWTCGRFNSNASVAIIYNLIDGIAYFFEDYSAQVIGYILSVAKNESFTVEGLSDATGIGTASLIPFMGELCELAILSSQHITKELSISQRRRKLNIRNTNTESSDTHLQSSENPIAMNDAELAYKNKVGGIVSVMLELTYNCSEKCIHCYNIGATRNDKEISHRQDVKSLTFSEYQRIIDELYDEGTIKVCLTGGDPFSNPDAWKIIEYLYKKGIAVDIYTNGLGLIGKEERLASFYPRVVGISLYSGLGHIHDSITRISGSWQKTMTVIENLCALSVPVVLKCAVFNQNVKSYYLVSEVAKRWNIPVQYELNIVDSIEGDKCVSRHLRLNSETLEIVLRDSRTPLYVGPELDSFGRTELDKDSNICHAGYGSFCITPDGNLIPCCSFHLVLGNLRHQHLSDILTKNGKLERWQSLKIGEYEDCGKHKYCGFCSPCAGQNYVEHGTPLKASSNNCYIAKTRYLLSKKMSETNYDPLNGKSLEDQLQELSEFSSEKIQREF